MEASYVAAVVVTGLVIVFAGLFLLIICVKIMSKFLYREPAPTPPPTLTPATPIVTEISPEPIIVVEDGIPAEVVAAISAAIACMSDSNTPFVIKDIKKISRNSTGRNAWAMAGLQQNTQSF